MFIESKFLVACVAACGASHVTPSQGHWSIFGTTSVVGAPRESHAWLRDTGLTRGVQVNRSARALEEGRTGREIRGMGHFHMESIGRYHVREMRRKEGNKS